MKRAAELHSLSHDHHHALVLARRCRLSRTPGATPDSKEAWQQAREDFTSRLEPHFRIEEETLLPALEAIGEMQLVQRTREDHAALRALAALEVAGDDDVERFGILLDSHVRFEEREMFEVAQSRLAASVLASIAEACRRTPRTAPACSTSAPTPADADPAIASGDGDSRTRV